MMNWPDLRDGASDKVATKPSRFQTTWCYGAPGIGPARLGALCPWRNAAVRFAIDAALETTRRQGFGANHSLCHGDLGNLDLFHEASVRLDEPKWGLSPGSWQARSSTMAFNKVGAVAPFWAHKHAE